MELNRRDFLRASLVAAATVSVPMLASATIAETATITGTVAPILPVANPHQHIIDALKLYDKVIADYAKYKGRREFSGEWDPKLNDQLHASVDELFEHIYATFRVEKSEKVLHAFRDIVNDRTVGKIAENEIRKIPPVYIEEVWPAAMMKVILRDRALPISHRKLKTFGRFHNTYGWMILNDTWKEAQRWHRKELG